MSASFVAHPRPPNAAAAQARFAVAVLAVGVTAGAAGTALTLLLHAVQHVAFGYTENTFLIGVERASAVRRVVAVGLGGLVAGTGWWLLRRRLQASGEQSSISVTHALTARVPRLAPVATVIDALLQLIAVGAGGSLGREGAPRQVGALLGGTIAARLGLTHQQRRVLLAAGAGAGLAAVYNVPFGGAMFTLEVLLATAAPAAVVTAVAAAWLAAVVAWPVLGTGTTYDLPHLPLGAPAVVAVTVAAPLLGALAGLFGRGFRALMTRARLNATTGSRMPIAMTVVFLVLGATAIGWPQLLGNGKALTQFDLAGQHGLALLMALVVLKPLATAACLRAGAIGGLLTPSLATGATLGLVVFGVAGSLWPAGSAVGLVLVGAAGLLTGAQRAPLTAIVLTVEFTHAPIALWPAVILAVGGAEVTARRVSAYAAAHPATTSTTGDSTNPSRPTTVG